MSRELAPIALFAYNRPEHLRRTLEALSDNNLADESELIVFSDGPRRPDDRAAVEEVRQLLRSTSGFRRVTVQHAPANLGLAQSIVEGVSRVIARSGRVIVLEDDMVTSPYFLKYMNDALDVYADEERVISVSGYSYPVDEALPSTFFRKAADCWGWGTWARDWALWEPNGALLLAELQRRGLQREFDLDGAYPYVAMLEAQIRGENDSWAIRWQAAAQLADKLTLYPGRSLLWNIGVDGSGEHCGVGTEYGDETDLAIEPVLVGGIAVASDLRIDHIHQRYFREVLGYGDIAAERPLVRRVAHRVRALVQHRA
jgi:hypothetical protein